MFIIVNTLFSHHPLSLVSREPPSSEDEGKPSLPATIDEPGSSKMSGDDGGGGDDGELSALKKELSLYKVRIGRQ